MDGPGLDELEGVVGSVRTVQVVGDLAALALGGRLFPRGCFLGGIGMLLRTFVPKQQISAFLSESGHPVVPLRLTC